MKALMEQSAGVFRGRDLARRQKASRIERLSSELPHLDELLGGGFPRGAMVELIGGPSSGRSTLALRVLARAAAQDELTAYVDAFDALDPLAAQACGVDLEKLLWVRCASAAASRSMARAFKAADMVARGGGFGALVLDLDRPSAPPGESGLTAPCKTFFRLQKAVERTPLLMLVLNRRGLAGSAASLALSLRRASTDWGLEAGAPHPCVLRGAVDEIEVMKGRSYGSTTLHCGLCDAS
ncbi:MAG TPA: ATPase domain-containing protein [Acidobacteriota bacterium]|nr:ATPase domain-containing protein [Acidobacteriota bacterium]